MYKQCLSIVVFVVASTVASSALAGKAEAFGACKSEAMRVYGADTGVKLIKTKDSSKGYKVKLKVRLAEGGSKRVSCVVTKGDNAVATISE
ncbi:MAG: hypothetical protein CNF01_08995 [Halieaceae bacterium MED-G27]|nr:MAG: hypothetical protein CBB81_01955 [Cellvibrionales bacterium TMED21]PDH33535.1 MAG: hypothetical protein CNF01_08995 [Halieaceae bacterium MED-G27]|tara:strand:+ start:320 stop:592 length:273 start_codon:yes stop_codon:yes gene_type:complete